MTMKTLDEVIDDFEKACDLERRCENCSGCLGQENGCPYDGAESVPDALYLKEYKNTDENYKKAIAHVIEVIDHYEKMVADYLAVNNPPLTWEELTQMIGKPVWVESKRFGNHWYMNRGIKDESCMYFVGHYGENVLLYHDDLGKSWQAYRKERE